MNNFNLPLLKQVPNYRITKTEDGISELFYENEPYNDHPTEVFAYMGIPQNVTTPVPAMVLVHGGLGRAFKEWVQMWVNRGYAAIAMDFGGLNADCQRYETSGPAQTEIDKMGIHLEWKNLWTFHSVCSVIRAHSILLAQPEVDTTRTGLTGISWGGYLTCCVAGLDDRFKCAIPVYGCGFLIENSALGWQELFERMSSSRLQWWHKHCDPSIYLPQVKIPMLFVTGTNDFAYPLDSMRKSARLPQSDVQACITLEMKHSQEDGSTPLEIPRFTNELFGITTDTPLPRMTNVTQTGTDIHATVKSSLPLTAQILWTTGTDAHWMQRKWQTHPLPIIDNTISTLIPKDATCFLLSVTDTLGGTISSLPMMPN